MKSSTNIFAKASKSIEPPKKSPRTLSPIAKEKVISRPKAVMCHICGREFGTASIEIHTKNCAALWEEREKLKPPNQRRPVPEAPTDIPISKTIKNLNAHNERVYESFNQNVMVRCSNCFRTFLEDRIEIHLKSCTSENPHKIAPSVAKSSEGQDIKTYVQKSNLKVYKEEEEKAVKDVVRPKVVMCHIWYETCSGKEYGTASIEIHVKACAKLWEERELNKPANQRKPVPEIPQDLPLGTTSKALEKRNNIVNEAFNNNVMIQCPHCSRTFLEDRIEIHLKSCTAENPHKRPPTNQSKSPEIRKYNLTEKPSTPIIKSSGFGETPQKTFYKPKAVMCHICGREFGTASIDIHLKNCAALWEEREKLKPPNQRRPVPEAPIDIPILKTAKNLNAHNERVYESFNQNVMVRCPNCFRTFLEDRIEIHLKSCTSENPHKIAPSVAKSSEGQDIKTYVQNSNLKVYKEEEEKVAKDIVRPKVVMCHICGKEYGTASIEIHVKACAKLWEEREQNKPANQRKPVPEIPQDLPLGTTPKALEKRNNIVNEAFNNNVMIQCPHCSRTFLEDRIEIHLKSCTAENPHKPPPTNPSKSSEIKTYAPTEKPQIPVKSSYEPLSQKPFVKPKTVMCHICGREFGTASIEIHLKSCAALWEEREKNKPSNQRRPVPEAPIDIPISKTMKNLTAHNERVYESFNQNVMVRCPNCFRTFLEDRIEVHLKSCTAENPHKPAPSITKSSEGQSIQTYIQSANLNLYSPPSPKPEKSISHPKSILCHICGKQYGTASIEIHIVSCTKLWEAQESKKPLNQRRPIPSAPQDIPLGTSSKALEKRNNLAYEAFASNAMVQCPNCFRTFLEDRLQVHLRSCTEDNPHRPASTVSPSPVVKQFKAPDVVAQSTKVLSSERPKSMMCHVCGREFGTASLEIHLKTCKRQWEEREMQKPPENRRSMPEIPAEVMNSKTVKGLAGTNEIVSEHFNRNSLVPCPNCSRTFKGESLEVHLRSCNSEKPHKPPPKRTN